MEDVPCNLCGSTDARLRYAIRVNDSCLRFYRYARHADADLRGTFRIVQCRSCDLLYVNPRVNAEQLARIYADNRVLGGNWRTFSDYLFDAEQPDDLCDVQAAPTTWVDHNQAWRFELMAQHGIKPGATILDLGCGRGEFVRAALDRGYDAFGVDASSDRVELGHATLDLEGRIFRGTAAYLPAALERRFDLITLWDVLEHLPDPHSTLRNLRSSCHEKTRVFLQTMSLDSTTYRLFRRRWLYIHPTIHLYYFSDATLAALLDRTGFDLLARENDDSKAPTPLRLARSLLTGLAHQLLFAIYAPRRSVFKALKPMLRRFQGGLSDDRMARRIENLYPGFYAGRMRDCFVYVAQCAGTEAVSDSSTESTLEKTEPARTLSVESVGCDDG